MSSWLAYFAFRAVETVARMLPVSVAWRLGAWLGRLSQWLMPGYHRLVVHNLTIAFGREMSAEEICTLARRHFRHLGGNFMAGMKIPFMSPGAVNRHLEVEGIEKVEAAFERGTGVVFVLMHMGNWEILSQAEIVAPGRLTGALYQPLHNPPLNAHVLRCRERMGCKLFNRQEGFHAPVAFVRENRIVGVLSDQRAGESGVWCPFFGRLASTTTLPPLIAKRAGAPMFPVGIITMAPGRWKLIVGDAIPGISHGHSAGQVAAVMNERLEQLIRLSPADWFWVHNRWKTPKPEFLLATAKRGMALPPGRNVDELQPFEIIIRAPETLSDACFSIPAVRAIRRGRPDSRITILTSERLAGFWELEEEVDEVLSTRDGASVSETARAVKGTGRQYDAGILFSETRRAARELAKSGVDRITGYEGRWRRRLLDQVISPKKNPGPVAHRTRDFLRIALRIGANVDDPTLHDPIGGGAVTEGRIVIGLCPGGANGPAQRWPLERWAEAAKLAAAAAEIDWVIFGDATETETGSQLAALIGPNCTDLTGQTTISELAGRLRRCHVVVAHDSGPLHFAALLGVPVTGIFGPTEPAHTAPSGDDHSVVRRHVECSPCFLRACPLDHRCMTEITPQRVAAAILQHCKMSTL